MTQARLNGLYLLLFGSVVFTVLGLVLEKDSKAPMLDFTALYYPARCFFNNVTRTMKVKSCAFMRRKMNGPFIGYRTQINQVI